MYHKQESERNLQTVKKRWKLKGEAGVLDKGMAMNELSNNEWNAMFLDSNFDVYKSRFQALVHIIFKEIKEKPNG